MDLSFEALCNIWFVVLGALLVGYAVLDGFDLGVGMLHPFVAKNDNERRLVLNSIGPLWDGNEVWLVTFGGAMFAMFPNAYASVFSGFYTAFVVLLFSLIFRAVSIEFRSKVQSAKWRTFWDWGFFGGSFCAALLFGVAVGNLVAGIELDSGGDFAVTLADQIRPYTCLIGLLATTAFALHGAIFLYLKTEDALQSRIYPVIWSLFGWYLVLYIIATVVSIVFVPRVVENLNRYPQLWLLPLLHVLAVANIPRCLFHGWAGWAFASSCLNIGALVGLFGAALYPYLIPPPPSGPSIGLTLFDAASSQSTLTLGLYIVLLGMPLVLIYTTIVYWSFRGKTSLNAHSY